MSGRILLDTNIVIALLASDPLVTSRIVAVDQLMVPVIVVGELYYGCLNSVHREENLRKITELASKVTVIACDRITAYYYAQIKAQLKAKGRPIPENDIWIAATAVQHGLALASRDAHFEAVEGLSLERW